MKRKNPLKRSAKVALKPGQRRPSRDEIIDSLTPEQREVYAEYLRERIYATLTLLAVLTTLWQHASEHTIRGAFFIIIGTVGALYLATIVANNMSSRITGHKKKRTFSRSPASGLLEPAYVPALLALGAGLGIFPLKGALLASIIVLVLSLFLFSVLSGRKTTHGRWPILLYSLAQLGIGLLVVWLKISLE